MDDCTAPLGYQPYCECCWTKGFSTPAKVVVGEGNERQALCIGCHGDHEKAKAEAEEEAAAKLA